MRHSINQPQQSIIDPSDQYAQTKYYPVKSIWSVVPQNTIHPQNNHYNQNNNFNMNQQIHYSRTQQTPMHMIHPSQTANTSFRNANMMHMMQHYPHLISNPNINVHRPESNVFNNRYQNYHGYANNNAFLPPITNRPDTNRYQNYNHNVNNYNTNNINKGYQSYDQSYDQSYNIDKDDTFETTNDRHNVCWEFNTFGGCKKGSKCKWQHKYLLKEAINPYTGEKLDGMAVRKFRLSVANNI